MSITLIILLLTACCRLRLSDAAGCFNPVPLCKRACLHQGIKVPLGESVDLHSPCQNWVCLGLNATHGDLLVTECVRVAARPPLVVVLGGDGVFPECCPKLRRDPKFAGIWNS